ncbi:EF-hand domain-containing protein [archaeon]|nr:MAG: EF-hand domain-containing protein [archaeon]
MMSAKGKKLVAGKSERSMQTGVGKADSAQKSTTLRSSLKGKDKGTGGGKPKADPGAAIIGSSSGKLSNTSGSIKITTAAPTVDKSTTLAKKKGRSVEVKAPPPKKKARVKTKKRTFFEKLALSMGFYVGSVVLHDPRAIEAAQALNLQQWHLRRLKAKFDQVDIDGSGNIDLEEFFEAVGEARSPFTDKLFALIDLDGSGTIEFDEYVRVLATYCMFTKDEILRFCFECFDVDRSGSIDEREFIELCKCINNAAPSFPNNFKKALEEFDVNEDGLIDYGEFLEIDRRYPLVLFPAFRLQDVMQRNSLGMFGYL